MASEFIAGDNRLTADIVDRSLAVVGPGPLVSCLGLDCDTVLSQAGRFSARFPANDPRLVYLELKKHFLWFYYDGVRIFRGLAEAWNIEIDNDGQRTLVVTGRDELAELAETSIDFTKLTDLDPSEPTSIAPSLILIAYNLLGTGEQWANVGITTTETPVYADFAGETALSALTKVAEHIGESFRLYQEPGGDHGIEWLGSTAADSGVRAVQGAGDPIDAEDNPHICFIQRLTERRDASRMMTKLYPFGAGLGETRLDLLGHTRTVPAGITYNAAENSISSDAALVYIGKTIARHVNFKDIRPLFNTDADIVSAKNYLFDASMAYLGRNDSVDDVVEYDLQVVQLPAYVRVGQSVRVVYQDDRYDLDTDLVLLGIRRNIGSDGSVTYTLTVATTNQWRLRESSTLVAQIEESEIFAGHPQIDANTYWENFREIIGDDQIDHMAECPFVLSEEVVTIRQVLFRYKVERLLTATKNYALASGNTAQNATSNTGASSATATADTNTPASGAVNTSSTGGASSAFTGASPDVTGVSAVTVNTTGATAVSSVAVNTTSVVSPDAFTDTNFGGIATATQTPTNWVPDPSIHHHDIGGHVHDFAHTHQTQTHTHPTTAEHGHTASDHNHSMSHVHGMDHSHAMPHTHNIPHTHNMAHVHASPQHVHALPAFTETFGVSRIPALNSYIMSDLEYAVNGGSWVSLDSGIPVAGGYFQVDVTPEIQNPDGLRRPFQQDNLIQVRRKTAAGTGKSAQLRVKLNIRSTVQSIVLYS